MARRLAYCDFSRKAPPALLQAVRHPDPAVVEDRFTADRRLPWSDNLFMTACRVPGHEGHGGQIPPEEARQAERIRIVELFIAYGADSNMRNKRKVSALHMACRFGLDRVAARLIELGAEVDARDEVRETPLFRAVNLGYEACVEVLVAAGADVNFQNRKGMSSLHRAVVRGKQRIVPLLLAAGADRTLADKAGKVPRDYSRNRRISAFLEEG